MFFLQYILLTFVVMLFEATVVPRIGILGVTPDLGLALVVYAGLAGGGGGGTLIGLLIGLLRGSLEPEWLGLDVLLLSAVGFAAAYTSPKVDRDHPVVQGILIALLLLGHDTVRVLAITEFSLARAIPLWLSSAPGTALYTGILVPTAVHLWRKIYLGGPRSAFS